MQSKRSRMGRVRGRRPRCLERSRSVAGWGELGVADPGVLERSRSIARLGEFGVADPGVWCAVEEKPDVLSP